MTLFNNKDKHNVNHEEFYFTDKVFNEHFNKGNLNEQTSGKVYNFIKYLQENRAIVIINKQSNVFYFKETKDFVFRLEKYFDWLHYINYKYVNGLMGFDLGLQFE